MLLILEGFQYTTSLDLNMGYYHIQTRKTQVTYVRLLFRGKISSQESTNGIC